MKMLKKKFFPLLPECSAWKKLSPYIEDYVDRFKEIKNNYIKDVIDSRIETTGYINNGFGLLQKWNLISKSYNLKYEISIYENPGLTIQDIKKREQDLEILIKEL